jgi:hypothetical protein
LDLDEPGLDDQKLLNQAMRNVLRGPPSLRSELQRAVEDFEYLVKPILRGIEEMVKPLGIESAQSTLGEENQSQASDIKEFLENIETTEKDGQAVQQKLRETLEKWPRFEEIDSEFQSAGELLRHANTMFKNVALEFAVLHDLMAEEWNCRVVIETQRRAVGLMVKSTKHSVN